MQLSTQLCPTNTLSQTIDERPTREFVFVGLLKPVYAHDVLRPCGGPDPETVRTRSTCIILVRSPCGNLGSKNMGLSKLASVVIFECHIHHAYNTCSGVWEYMVYLKRKVCILHQYND